MDFDRASCMSRSLRDRKPGLDRTPWSRAALEMPGAGIEPAWGCPRGILSPLRLPISPPGRRAKSKRFEACSYYRLANEPAAVVDDEARPTVADRDVEMETAVALGFVRGALRGERARQGNAEETPTSDDQSQAGILRRRVRAPVSCGQNVRRPDGPSGRCRRIARWRRSELRNCASRFHGTQ